jgi:hypothetical protein
MKQYAVSIDTAWEGVEKEKRRAYLQDLETATTPKLLNTLTRCYVEYVDSGTMDNGVISRIVSVLASRGIQVDDPTKEEGE